MLLAAAVRLLRLPGVPAPIRKPLRRLRLRLDGVSGPAPGGESPEWRPSRLNARYHTALGLAELVLRGGSYELENGSTVRVDGLLLQMWRVFETFVTRALTDALRPYGGRCGLQDRHHLDRRRRVGLKPDLVYYQARNGGRDTPVSVLDVKYKIESGVRGITRICTRCSRTARFSAWRGAILFTPKARQSRPLTSSTGHGTSSSYSMPSI